MRKNRRKKSIFSGGSKPFVFFLALAILVLAGFFLSLKKQDFFPSFWDGKRRLNFLVIGKTIEVVSFSPIEEAGGIILLPPETYLETTHGYGNWRLSSILSLSEQENRKETLLRESLEEFLGIPLDGFLFYPSFLKFKAPKALFFAVLGRVRTNFRLFDLWQIWQKAGPIRFEEKNTFDLKETSVLSELVLKDGSRVYSADVLQLDQLVSKFATDENLRNENLKIEVVNASGKAGLAKRGARIIGNIGGDVISLKGSETEIDKCQIKSEKKNRGSYTLKRIGDFFHCDYREGIGESRADMVVVLGNDYFRKLTEK